MEIELTEAMLNQLSDGQWYGGGLRRLEIGRGRLVGNWTGRKTERSKSSSDGMQVVECCYNMVSEQLMKQVCGRGSGGGEDEKGSNLLRASRSSVGAW